MTTNLNAVAGPSRMASLELSPSSPPLNTIDPGSPTGTVSKPGLSVDENGDVVKVPAFLNKLFRRRSMVSDPDTDDMIYWAPNGDSFYGVCILDITLIPVPNHERFGKELLPRFFKHSNFSSFVRQLNMYGFHKVPHLQSGVLKNDAPSELWEFVNPHFKKGHPELLARVTRKNHRPAPAPAGSAAPQGRVGPRLLTDGTVKGDASLVGPSTQMIDLGAIQSGINAIRQTQAAIGADLKALQSSNEHLWREAIESRERQQKHEETIDLIVTFLERLFGTEGEGLKGLKEAMRRGGIGRSREENVDEGSKKRRRLGVDRMLEDGQGDEAQSRFHEISEPSEPPSGASSSRSVTDDRPRFTAVSENATPDPLLPSDNNAVAPYGFGDAALLDPNLMNTTIGSLLQSPTTAQLFLNSLNAHGNAARDASTTDPTLALLSPLPTAVTDNTNQLINAYQRADGVGTQVDGLQESIDSFVRSMGLDSAPDVGQQPGFDPSLAYQPGALEDPFDVGEFLRLQEEGQ